MTLRPIDFTDSITFIWTPHTKSCGVSTHEECVCLLVSGSLTCPSCEAYQASAPRCKACRIISSGRKAYVAAARREIQHFVKREDAGTHPIFTSDAKKAHRFDTESLAVNCLSFFPMPAPCRIVMAPKR